MVESQIKQLLNTVPRSSMIQTPHGSVALLTSRIESAGGDLDEVRAWVFAQGGREGKAEAGPSKSLRAGKFGARPARVARYFAVPTKSLD
jgi:hypothetical protein